MTEWLTREQALLCVGDGWSKLINNLYDAKPKDTAVIQIKEKFGTLRFYVSFAPDWYYDLIDYYENMSGTICERCGQPGWAHEERSWILTLCDKCNAEEYTDKGLPENKVREE